MKAVGYVRVSTEEQAAEGVSLEAQRAKIAAWCVANDCELVQVFEDAGISGCRTGNRPGFKAAVETACKLKAAFVVYSLTRASRSTRETLELSEHLDKAGADFVSLSERIDTTTAAGRMIFRMLAVLGEFERDQIVERTKAALAHKKASGLRIGGIPYGKTLASDGKSLVDSGEEQKVIELVLDLRQQEKTLRQIQAELQQRQVPNRKGNVKWRLNTLATIAKQKVA